MKDTIILVNPPLKPDWESEESAGSGYPPMGILLVGSLLKKNGYDVKIIDGAVLKRYCIPEIEKNILSSDRTLYVGLSVMTSQILPALDISGYVKKKFPDVKIVWGGIHPTLFPEQTLKEDCIDVVVIGEGEKTALELAQMYSGAEDKQLEDIKGIAYKKYSKPEEIIVNPSREFSDINTLPSFDFEIIDVDKYISNDFSAVGGRTVEGGAFRRSLPILAGLGCPYRCTFCINAVLGKKYRPKKAELIVDEIERLMGKYGANDFGLIDEDFFADKRRVENFLALVEKKNLKFSWHTSTRANYFNEHYINEEFLKRLRKNGFFHFGLGAESGSKRILEMINKKITPEQVEGVARLSKKCGVNVGFSFMCALPGEKEEETIETVKFCYRLLKINPSNYIIGPQVFRPYPGSPLYEKAVNYGLKVPDSLREWGKVYNDIEGYFKLETLPWVKNPSLIRRYIFYLHFTYQKVPPRKFWKKIFFPILKLLSILRFEINFFGIPFEFVIFNKVLRKSC